MLMDVSNLKLVELPATENWEIRHHRLYDLSPYDASAVTGFRKGWTIWHTHFDEDLFLAVNSTKGELVDVGWYPDADPNGNFRLVLLNYDRKEEVGDWDNPLIDLVTRSIDTIRAKLRETLGE